MSMIGKVLTGVRWMF